MQLVTMVMFFCDVGINCYNVFINPGSYASGVGAVWCCVLVMLVMLMLIVMMLVVLAMLVMFASLCW
jgi:hypothetical protein